MTQDQNLIPAIYQGWHDYQRALISAIAPLTDEQLALTVAPKLRTVDVIALHMIGVRA